MNSLPPHSLNEPVIRVGRLGNWKVGCLLDHLLQGGAMLAISLCCAAVGMAMGARFRILILGPAAVLALVTTICFGVAARWGFREVAITSVSSLAALQLGYFASCLVRPFVKQLSDRYKPHDRWIPRHHL